MEQLRIRLEALRELVDMEDIPHPTVPEYREHHESIQKILKEIDSILSTCDNRENCPINHIIEDDGEDEDSIRNFDFDSDNFDHDFDNSEYANTLVGEDD